MPTVKPIYAIYLLLVPVGASCASDPETPPPAITADERWLATEIGAQFHWQSEPAAAPPIDEQVLRPIVTNGGFEDGFAGWTVEAEGWGIDGDLSRAWLVGDHDPNAHDFDIYYGGMPHAEPLAHRGDAGASAVENAATFHRLYQDIELPSAADLELSFHMRWKNQVERWRPGYQDIIISVRDPDTDVLLATVLKASDDLLPWYSGRGDTEWAEFERITADLSAFAGQTVRLDFATEVVDFFLYVDLDEIAVEATPRVEARCQDVVLSADEACAASGSIDAGSSAADGGAIAIEHSPAGPYPLGETEVRLDVTTAAGDSAWCQAVVTVADHSPPTVAVAPMIVREGWPDGDMLTYRLSDCAEISFDNCDGALDIDEVGTITDITSDEPAVIPGWRGDPADDIEIVDDSTFRVRNQRDPDGNGRVYRVWFTVADAAGNHSAAASCQIGIPVCAERPIDDHEGDDARL
ncbi:MAG: hypothetical protein Tsb0020_54230 [Haliangiales bacterium]